jgi:16S rRNA C967 or C1407 C5-methylase (RsmB/RsmF family)/NOL1/NOP2/fmu family ribosome biogenesis protein
MLLPEDFIRRTSSLLGEEAFHSLQEALQGDAVISLRRNALKADEESLVFPTDDGELTIGTPVPWCRTGRYIDRRPAFTLDPLLHAGCYYVQEAASMFLEQVLRQYVGSTKVNMLDLCAAPGGKSTHARALLSDDSLLVANEVIRSRAQILAENLTKWGHPSVVVTQNDPADFRNLPGFFDVILADVPCSGEGMFRKDRSAVSEWSEENVLACSRRQRRIVTDVWDALKPNGLFIYSTCTFNIDENEANVRYIAGQLGADILPVETDPHWNITGNLQAGERFPVYRFLPGRTRGEGFFLAVLRKHAADSETTYTAHTDRKRKDRGKPSKEKGKASKRAGWEEDVKAELFASMLLMTTEGEKFDVLTHGSRQLAFPKEHIMELELLRDALHIMQAGVTIGQRKGSDFVPDHALAVSTLLRREVFPAVQLTREEAIAYLRREAVMLPADTPEGYVLMTYCGVPLGFMKNIGTRANSLYPPEWRIKNARDKA